MAVKIKLQPPKNLTVDFKPSERQYEVWKHLSETCPKCQGSVYIDDADPDNLVPKCKNCGNENIPRIVLGGGAAGGGKTFLGCMFLGIGCIRFAGIKGVIGRKTLKSAKESTLATLLHILKGWGLEEDVNYNYNSNLGVLKFWNDSTVSLIELADTPSDADFSRLGSVEYTIGFIEEVDQVSEKAMEILASRLRWKLADSFIVPKLFLATNPTTCWVRDRFVLDSEGNPAKLLPGDAYIPFKVDDNPDKDFVATYKASLQKIRDVAQRERLLEGNWNFVEKSSAAYYSNFDGNKHLVTNLYEKYYDKYDTLILGFDFNGHPYMSCLEVQVDYNNKKVYFLREHLGKPEDKLNGTAAFSRHLADKFSNIDHKESFLITGDPSGKAQKTVVEQGVNEYSIIKQSFDNEGLPNHENLLPGQPPHKQRGEFINDVLAGKVDGWEILIDLRCKKLIDDLSYQLSDEKGRKDKSKVKDPKTGVKYEKYGHMSDIFDYIICLFLKKEFGKYNKSGGVTKAYTSQITPLFSY